MSLREDIKPYTDGNGLVSSDLVPPGVVRGSDNGPLFTSQYLMLSTLGKSDTFEISPFLSLLKCIDKNKYLHRDPSDSSPDAPDDHYGVISLLCLTGVRALYIKLPWNCCHPMLLYIRAIAQGSLLARLFSPIAFLIIALSNLNEPIHETSNKLLTWMIIKGLERRTHLCTLAGDIWRYRMRKLYPEGLIHIPTIYFGPKHPFVKYWID